MIDLKFIDELLLDLMRAEKKQPREMFHHSSVAQEAMLRLRKAWVSGEMPAITATWATYFEEDLI
jgi:hypothetical protein